MSHWRADVTAAMIAGRLSRRAAVAGIAVCSLVYISVEVADVDDVHSRAVSRGLNIVYPLTNEPWGVRRFFVTDPNGTVINVLCHIGWSQMRLDHPGHR